MIKRIKLKHTEKEQITLSGLFKDNVVEFVIQQKAFINWKLFSIIVDIDVLRKALKEIKEED